MEIRQLRHFVAVADALNFREAAERCAITQQAMSKSIMQLETRLGFKLLDRDRKSVLLTAFGSLLLPFARTILAEVHRFEDVLDDMTGRGFGQLKLGATPTLLDDIVPVTLRRFQARYPGVRISVETGDFTGLRELMLQGDLDLMLSTAPDDLQSHLVAVETIGTDRNVVVVRADHPLTRNAVVTGEALSAYPHIATHNYRKGEAYVARLFAAAGLPVPQYSIRTISKSFALNWIQQADDWWVVPERLVGRGLAAGVIVALPVDPADQTWPLVLATRRHATRSPAASAYAQIVRNFMRGGGDTPGIPQ